MEEETLSRPFDWFVGDIIVNGLGLLSYRVSLGGGWSILGDSSGFWSTLRTSMGMTIDRNYYGNISVDCRN